MNAIGTKLKELREQNKLTRKEVSDKLRELDIDISDKTLYGYESGRNSANADMFLALCKIYKCTNVMETFSNSVDDILFSNDEWCVIEQYRILDDFGKKHINYELDREVKRTKESAKKERHIQELESTQATVIDIQPRLDNNTRLIEYHRSASAGTGVFILGNETVDQLPIPDTPENRKVDYAIKVSGNSMEPDYNDGDIVLVSQKVELNHGDVGIFIINNNAYIKEYGETELISRNPDADNITISEYDNIVCMGKVVGKYEE